MTTTTTTARMLRYEVPVDDQWHTIDVPVMMRIAHVAARNPNVVEFWAEQWDELPGESGVMTAPRTFRVYGTGHPFNPHEVMHRGTTLTADGSLVWHLYQRVER